MKVLHISDDPLPDIRIEKMAYLAKKRRLNTFFAGPGEVHFALNYNVFDKCYQIPWNRYARLGFSPYFRRLKNKLRKVIDKVNPDIIHAHDVFAAKSIYDLDYPFVFDDHELVSLEKKSDFDNGLGLFDQLIARYEVRKWRSWERKICEKAPIITVSEGIAEAYLNYGAKTFVVPNYPSVLELNMMHLSQKKESVFTAFYMGSEVISKSRPFRNLKGITKLFKSMNTRLVIAGDAQLTSTGNIISKGFIPHLDLYHEMSKCHIGLVPWKKHWFHQYANPNKPYMYAHAGLIVFVTSTLINVIKAFNEKCHIIENHSDLKQQILNLEQNFNEINDECDATRQYAQQNFIFDLFEEKLFDAYKET